MTQTLSNTGTGDSVGLSLRQFAEAWRLMCTGAPGHTLAEDGGIYYAFSGRPIPFFNIALLTDREISTEALEAQARRACTFAAGKDVPWFFVVTHETLDAGTDAAAVLDAHGLMPMMPLTGMLASEVASLAVPPAGLDLAVPPDDAACEQAVDINALAYGMNLDAGKDLIGRQSFWSDHVLVVGRAEGKPASSAAVMMIDGYRYVALVATDPACQRRGYADATMRQALALAAARFGPSATVLHATAAGRPVYERMGYTVLSNHTLFMEKRFAEGH